MGEHDTRLLEVKGGIVTAGEVKGGIVATGEIKGGVVVAIDADGGVVVLVEVSVEAACAVLGGGGMDGEEVRVSAGFRSRGW